MPLSAFEGLSMDLITDLFPDPDGNCYLLVVVCCFSKWVKIIPLRSKLACEVAIVVYWEVFARYGRPKWIRVNAGQEWDFKVISELLGITVRITSLGYPRADG